MTSDMPVTKMEESNQRLSAGELACAGLYLDQTTSGVLGALKHLSDTQWTFRPGPDSWSIAEITEHIILAQHRLLGPVRAEIASAAPPNQRQFDDTLIYRFSERFRQFPTPDPLIPKGSLSRGDGVQHVAENYARLRQYLESGEDLRGRACESPGLHIISDGAFQKMDGYQAILIAAAHTERHTKQILEVIAHDRFPAE